MGWNKRDVSGSWWKFQWFFKEEVFWGYLFHRRRVLNDDVCGSDFPRIFQVFLNKFTSRRFPNYVNRHKSPMAKNFTQIYEKRNYPATAHPRTNLNCAFKLCKYFHYKVCHHVAGTFWEMIECTSNGTSSSEFTKVSTFFRIETYSNIDDPSASWGKHKIWLAFLSPSPSCHQALHRCDFPSFFFLPLLAASDWDERLLRNNWLMKQGFEIVRVSKLQSKENGNYVEKVWSIFCNFLQ